MKWQCHGITYYGVYQGNGNDLILFLHGFTGTHQTWVPYFPLFGNKAQLLSIDLIGHGQTDAPEYPHRYEIEKIAFDLKCLIEQCIVSRIHIVGYSMGGRVALTFASLFPEKVASLFIESSTPGLQTEAERMARLQQDALLADRVIKDGLEAFIDYWENIPLFATQKALPDQMKAYIRQERLSNRALGLANSLLGMGTGSMISVWNKLSSFKMPVTLVTGEKDLKFCEIAAKMKKENTHFKHVIIPNVGHAVHIEQPEYFGHLLQNHFEHLIDEQDSSKDN